MARKIRKKAEEKKQDEFISLSSKMMGFIITRIKLVAVTVVAVVAIYFAFVGYTYYRDSQNAKASVLFSQGYDYYSGQKVLDEDKALKPEERYQKAIDQFKVVIETYGSTSYANYAKLYQGLAKFHLGQFEEAKTELTDFQKVVEKTPELKSLATFVVARANEAVGDKDAALSSYDAVIADKNSPFSDQAGKYSNALKGIEETEKSGMPTKFDPEMLKKYLEQAGVELPKELQK